jgi:hypothetical protein
VRDAKPFAQLRDVPRRFAGLVRPGDPLELLRANGAIAHCAMIPNVDSELPSQRGETWNDTEAINRHRAIAPSQRVALAIELSNVALRLREAGLLTTERDQPPPDRS